MRESREADVAEVLEQAADCVLLEDDFVLARLQLDRTAHGVSLGGGLDPERLGIDLADVGRPCVRVPGRGPGAEAVHHHREERGPAALVPRTDAVRVRDGDGHDRRRERAGRLEPLCLAGGDDRTRAFGTSLGACLRRRGHVAKLRIVLAAVRLRQHRRALVRRRSLGDGGGTLDDVADAAIVEPVRAGHSDPSPDR